MKKVSKKFFVIAIISMLLLANCSYATEISNGLVENVTSSDMVIDGALDELYPSNQDEGIMLINEEDGVMPINEEGIVYSSDYVESDVYLLKQNVSYNKNVNGNVYVMGQNVEISSDWINGNLFVMAENVTIKGSISGSVYVLGQSIDIETEGVGTVYAMGQKVDLGNGANIVNDFKVSAETVNINGNIYRELYAGAKNINVSNTAEYVGRGKVYYSDNYTDENGILSTVELIKTESSEKIENTVKTAVIGATIRTQIINIISAVLVIIVIYFIIRNKFTEKEEVSTSEIMKSVVSGLCWLVFTPFVFVLLLCTIVGIPLAIMVLVLYCIALYISVPVASLKIGKLVLNELKQQNKLLIIVYAVCVYIVIELVSLIPTLGGVIKFLVVLYGLGTFMKNIFPLKDNKVENKEVVEVIETKAE